MPPRVYDLCITKIWNLIFTRTHKTNIKYTQISTEAFFVTRLVYIMYFKLRSNIWVDIPYVPHNHNKCKMRMWCSSFSWQNKIKWSFLCTYIFLLPRMIWIVRCFQVEWNAFSYYCGGLWWVVCIYTTLCIYDMLKIIFYLFTHKTDILCFRCWHLCWKNVNKRHKATYRQIHLRLVRMERQMEIAVKATVFPGTYKHLCNY